MHSPPVPIEKLSFEQIKNLLWMLMQCQEKEWFNLFDEEETNRLLQLTIADMAGRIETKLRTIITKKRKKKYDIKLSESEICAFITVFESMKDMLGTYEKATITTIEHQYDYWKKNKVEFITTDFLISNNDTNLIS